MELSQISRTLREEAAVSRVAAILPQERFDSRSALGPAHLRGVLVNRRRGRPQLAGYLKALGALAERVPGIVTPAPKAPAATGGTGYAEPLARKRRKAATPHRAFAAS